MQCIVCCFGNLFCLKSDVHCHIHKVCTTLAIAVVLGLFGKLISLV